MIIVHSIFNISIRILNALVESGKSDHRKPVKHSETNPLNPMTCPRTKPPWRQDPGLAVASPP